MFEWYLALSILSFKHLPAFGHPSDSKEDKCWAASIAVCNSNVVNSTTGNVWLAMPSGTLSVVSDQTTSWDCSTTSSWEGGFFKGIGDCRNKPEFLRIDLFHLSTNMLHMLQEQANTSTESKMPNSTMNRLVEAQLEGMREADEDLCKEGLNTKLNGFIGTSQVTNLS